MWALSTWENHWLTLIWVNKNVQSISKIFEYANESALFLLPLSSSCSKLECLMSQQKEMYIFTSNIFCLCILWQTGIRVPFYPYAAPWKLLNNIFFQYQSMWQHRTPFTSSHGIWGNVYYFVYAYATRISMIVYPAIGQYHMRMIGTDTE